MADSKIAFDPADSVVADLINGRSVRALLTPINNLSKDDFQRLLDTLSEAYHHSDPIISDDDYDLIESIFTAKYGKNLKVGAPPSKKASFKFPKPQAKEVENLRTRRTMRWSIVLPGPNLKMSISLFRCGG